MTTSDLDSEPFSTFATLVEEARAAGEPDPTAMVVATASLDARPSARTVLLPLWAGIPSIERARELVERTVCDPLRYWRPYGIPACPYPPPQPEALGPRSVSMLWNSLPSTKLPELP